MNAIDPPRQAATGKGAATRRVARNTVALVIGDTVTKIGVFVLYAVIARSIGKDAFGDYTLAVSLAFFIRVSALGTDLILSREVAREMENVHGLFWNTILLKLVAGAPVLGGVVVFTAVSGYSATLVAAVALIGTAILIDVIALSLHSVLQGRQEMGPPARALALESCVLVSVGTFVLLALDGTLVALGAVYVLAAVVALAYICAVVRRRGIRPRRRGDSRGLGWLARAALPTGIASFFGAALARLDAIILSAMTHDSGVVGLYGAAYRVFEATLFVNWAFGLAVLPMLSTLGRRTASLRRVFEVSCMAVSAVTVPLGAAMALFGPTLVKIIYGDAFAGGGTATRVLGGAAALYGVFTVAAMTIAGQDRQRLFPWISGVALVVNIGLNVLLIPPLSLDGAAIATTVAQAVVTGLTVWLAVRETGAVSPIRMFTALGGGVAAMGITALVLGSGPAALVAALIVYAAAFLAIERLLHGDDLMLFVTAIRERGKRPEPPLAADPAGLS